MPRENYLRIARGYEPGEPASFLEKAFYIFWIMICAFKVILMRIKVRMAKEERGNRFLEEEKEAISEMPSELNRRF